MFLCVHTYTAPALTRPQRHSSRYVCTRLLTANLPLYVFFLACPSPECVHRILPHLEVEKPLKNLGFFGHESQREYTYTTHLRITGIWP